MIINNKSYNTESQIGVTLQVLIDYQGVTLTTQEITHEASRRYKQLTGKKYAELTGRTVRTLQQNGTIHKISQGKYMYDGVFKDSAFMPFTQHQIKEILIRDEYTCQLCRNKKEFGADITADHIISQYDGGSNEISNGMALCSECDLKKRLKEAERLGIDYETLKVITDNKTIVLGRLYINILKQLDKMIPEDSEIFNIIQSGETANVEFKENWYWNNDNKRYDKNNRSIMAAEIATAIGAMVNSGGGLILVGIKDKHEPNAYNQEDTIEDLIIGLDKDLNHPSIGSADALIRQILDKFEGDGYFKTTPDIEGYFEIQIKTVVNKSIARITCKDYIKDKKRPALITLKVDGKAKDYWYKRVGPRSIEMSPLEILTRFTGNSAN